MNAEDYRRSKELFLELCRLPADEQEKRLAELDESTELLAEVRSLLEFFEEPEPDELEPTRDLDMAAASTVPSVFAPGTVIGDRYRVVRRLAEGGMGSIFEAQDLTLGSRVALKFLLPSAKTKHLLNEVRLARQVTHENVCRVYDFGEVDGRPFISMEYVDGEDLHSLLTRIGRIPRDRAVGVARQLFCGLAAAHAKGVLHRDLKPANIMIDGRGEVRITDFGIAVEAGDSKESPFQAGTPAFMAPEVLDGMAPTEKSDLYAMGLLLYEMCTGTYPFEATTQPEHRAARYGQPVPPPSAKVEDIDPLLERVILKCLEISPDDRPSSALVVAAAFGHDDPLTLAASVGETPSPEMVAEAGSAEVLTPRSGGLLLSLVVALLAFVVVGAESSRGLDRVDLSFPPEVLAEKAREKLQSLGWTYTPKDMAYGFMENPYALVTQKPDSPKAAPGTSTVLFWYRQSPEVMLPAGLHNLVVFSGQVGPYDPTLTDGGMALVLLHPSGTLDHLEVFPELREEDPAREQGSSATDFSHVVRAAGLAPESIETRQALFAPPFFADQRIEMTGRSALRPDLELSIRSAAYHGKTVYFRMVPSEDRPDSEAEVPWLLDLVDEWNQWWDLIFILTALAAIPLTRLNLRKGRSDPRNARRLAIFVFAVTSSLWLFRGPHVANIGTEWALIQLRLGLSLLQAGLVWLFYLALEPYVRRIWPQALISWTRLLNGRLRDPLVGRSVLVGLAVGVGWAAVIQLDLLLPSWLGLQQTTSTVKTLPFDYALSMGETLAGVGDHLIAGIQDAVFSLVFLLLLRLVLPKPWMAAATYVLLVTILYAHEGAHPVLSWLTVGFLVAVTEAVTLMKFGLLSYVTAVFSSYLLMSSPLTLDLTAWYAGTGLTAIGLVLALTGLAGYYALRPQRSRARTLTTHQTGTL